MVVMLYGLSDGEVIGMGLMSWDILEKVIVGFLISVSALYMAVRTWKSVHAKGSPCSGCSQASEGKGCAGCPSKTLKVLVWAILLLLPSYGHAAESMKLTSPDIRPGDYIHSKFTCQSRDVSPRLEFVDVPEKTKSLALVVHDPDAPSGDWVHWIVFNIPPDKFEVDEAIPPGLQGKNDFGKNRWDGPCPPSGTHHYIFDAYALDTLLDLKTGATRDELNKAMDGHILDKASFTGLYEKF